MWVGLLPAGFDTRHEEAQDVAIGKRPERNSAR